MTAFGDVASDTALTRHLPINGTNFRKGVTAPTDATVGTTPTVPVLLFDLVAETASTSERMPDEWDNGDVTFTLTWSLVNGQVNNDVADITLDYTASIPLSTGNGPSKASTQILGTTTVTTANGLAVDDVYETTFTLLAADATNPLASARLLHLEIHLTNLTGVAAIHLIDATITYTATR